MVRNIIQLINSYSGYDVFLKALTMAYQNIQPSHCFVATLDPLNQYATTFCYLQHGQQAKNFRYQLANSPCELVNKEGKVCFYPSDIQRTFPDDTALIKLNIQGYIGVQLRSHDNQVIGLLVCLFEQPFTDSELYTNWIADISYFIAQELWQKQENVAKQRLLKQLETGERLANIGTWHWDVVNDTIIWSKEAYRIFEMDTDKLSFEQAYQLVHHDDRDSFKHNISDIMAGHKEKYDTVHRIVLANGKVKYLKNLADVTKSDDGNIISLEGTVQDVTLMSQLHIDKKLSDFVINHTSESIMITNSHNEIVLVNKAMESMTGYSEEELIGRNPSMLSSGKQGVEFYQDMWETIGTTGHWRGELWNRRKNGQAFPEELSLNAVKNESGEISHYVAIFRDISKSKETENKLQFLADCDPLTSLANRRCFINTLEQQLIASTEGSILSVVFIDLDLFKAINDIYGHETGDLLLIEVANRLASHISGNDLLCRYGGDEFTLLIPHTSFEQTQTMVKQLQQCFDKPFKLDNIFVEATASIGVALSPDAGTSAKLLLRHANHAMRSAKSAGHNGISFHDVVSQRRYQYKLELKERLKLALEQGLLSVFYQPIVNIESNEILKFEALVRWADGNGGYITPGEFIPIAEEFGLIHLVGNFVLRQACADLKALHRQGFDQISFSINRSINEFFNDELEHQSIASVIKAAGLPYESIVIEITESTAMSENRYTKQVLTQLKRNGIKIALDDFCTGYSSLNYLIDYEVDFIKIDRSFINAIGHDKHSQILTSTVIELADKLGIEVIAEGVETDQQLAFLTQYGCRYVQGYFFSPALPFLDCMTLLLDKEASRQKNIRAMQCL